MDMCRVGAFLLCGFCLLCVPELGVHLVWGFVRSCLCLWLGSCRF